jgi:hypothetical protein
MAITLASATSDYVNLGQPSALNLNPRSEWTILCWAKTTTSSDSGTFIGKGDATTANRQYQLTYGSPGPPYQLQAVVGGTFYNSGAVGGNAIWHHCVLLNYDDAGTYRFRMYQDGAAVGTTAASGTATNAYDVLIGARRGTGNTGSGFLFSGSLDDMRVYNRALYVSEIETIYAARGRDSIVFGLVGRWVMLDREPGVTASGTNQVKDWSDQQNHGTASGSPSFSESYTVSRKSRFL